MVYCSNCGEKIPDDAYFCLRCGTKTAKGQASNAVYPSDELRDAFYKVGVEMERAFSIMAHETHNAFKKVKENFQQKNSSNTQAKIVCKNCGSENSFNSVFCSNCGSKLVFNEQPDASTGN